MTLPASDPLPSDATLTQIKSVLVYGADKSPRELSSLLEDGVDTMMVFIRHSYCASCQAYIASLASDLPNPLPQGKRLVIIGQSSPDIIPNYLADTNASSRFEMYVEPTATLYKLLDFTVNQTVPSSPPEYVARTKKSFLGLVKTSFLAPIRWVGVSAFWHTAVGKGEGYAGEVFRNGGEMYWKGTQLEFFHRMRDTQDHISSQEVKGLMGI